MLIKKINIVRFFEISIIVKLTSELVILKKLKDIGIFFEETINLIFLNY